MIAAKVVHDNDIALNVKLPGSTFAFMLPEKVLESL